MKKWIASLILMVSISGFAFMAVLPQTVVAAAGNPTCAKSFLGFPVWYRGLTVNDTNCEIRSPSDDLSGFIWHIALNVVEIALMAVGYITFFYLIYGGFLYLTSLGESADLLKARKTILNAIIGLVISFAAVALVDFASTSILK